MAFKSTIKKNDSLIWLKVVSTVVVEVPQQSNRGVSHDFEIKGGLHSPSSALNGADVSTSNPRKRRASSFPLEPAWKAPKTRSGQSSRRISDPGPREDANEPGGIEMCPEYLTQHDTTCHAIMKMVDSSGWNHRIFYLPQQTRSVYGGAGKRLSDILRRRPNENFDILWILRLSRLVAESVLRFDLRNSDPSPEESIVLYGARNKEYVPFLEVKLEKPRDLAKDAADDQGLLGRQNVLLDPGLILLHLGLERGKQLGVPTNVSARRLFIQEHARSTVIGDKYTDVILCCARFFHNSDKDGINIDDDEFRMRFFQYIVQPLKEAENLLLEQQETGKRWTETGARTFTSFSGVSKAKV